MGSLPKPIRKVIKIEIAFMLIMLLILNPGGGSFASSIDSQEFFTYHIKDVLDHYSGKKDGHDNLYLATGTYEEQLGGGLFGVAKGKNLIVVQMESMQNMVIGRDYNGQAITPELNGIISSPGTMYFDNFYSQIGSGNTSDAEFAANNSIMGSMESYTYQLYQNNYFKGLPWILKEAGYGTYVMHGYKKMFWNRENMYPALGFDKFFGDDYFKSDNIEGIGGGNIVGISDHAFFEQATDCMAGLPQPFYSMLITLSSHNPFRLPDSLKEIDIKPEDDNLFGAYVNSVHYADKCIGEFMELLKEKGLYDNSVVVFYGDHFAMVKGDKAVDDSVSNWLGTDYRYDTMMNVPLIIHIPGLETNATYENSGGQLDIMPTLAYLLGIEKLDTIYLGQNLFTGADSTVAVQVHMLKGSYIKGDQVFEISRDGIFENSKAWNRKTGEETGLSGCAEISAEAKNVIDLSQFYLNNDVLRLALTQGKDIGEIKAIAAGVKAKLPVKMDSAYIKRGDESAMADFYGSMLADKGKYALLMSDDIVSLLTDMESEYSGKSQVKGIGDTDEAALSGFIDVRNRIIPAVTENDSFTKAGYLGYDNVMFAPDADSVPAWKMNELIDLNNPCGVVLPNSYFISHSNIWAGCKVPVYIYDVNASGGSGTSQVYRRPWN